MPDAKPYDDDACCLQVCKRRLYVRGSQPMEQWGRVGRRCRKRESCPEELGRQATVAPATLQPTIAAFSADCGTQHYLHTVTVKLLPLQPHIHRNQTSHTPGFPHIELDVLITLALSTQTGNALLLAAPEAAIGWLTGLLRNTPPELAPAWGNGTLVGVAPLNTTHPQSPLPAADFVALRSAASSGTPPQLVDQWQQLQQQQLEHAAAEVAAWLLPSHALASVAANNSAVLVGGVQHQDAAVPLYDVALPYRDALALYSDSVVAVPLGAGPLLMFVRTDVVGAQVGWCWGRVWVLWGRWVELWGSGVSHGCWAAWESGPAS